MSVYVLGTHSEFRFKVQTLCLSKGMSRQLEISLVSPECMYSFPDSQEHVGAFQGLLRLSHFLGHPVKFLADLDCPYQYLSVSFRQFWCWSSSVAQLHRCACARHEYYAALERKSCYLLQCRWTFRTLRLNEAGHKRTNTVWFHSCSQNNRNKVERWLPGVGMGVDGRKGVVSV